jgi:hypothetical protein
MQIRILYSCLESTNVNIKIQKTIYVFVLYGCYTWSLTWRKNTDWVSSIWGCLWVYLEDKKLQGAQENWIMSSFIMYALHTVIRMTECYYSDPISEAEMGGIGWSNGKTRSANGGLVRKPEAKTPLGTDGEDDIKNWMKGHGLESFGSE